MNVNLEEELQKFEGEFEKKKLWTCESLEKKLDFLFSYFFPNNIDYFQFFELQEKYPSCFFDN
jgi:hypothetical protein